MDGEIVVTGLGMLTPLGSSAEEVLRRIRAGHTAATPTPWGAAGFSSPVYATIPHLSAEEYVPESKTLRLMSRDALLAVGAAHLAVKDAKLQIGADYAAEEVGLFGSTGMAGMALSEVKHLVEAAAGDDGGLDLKRFGAVALKHVRPVLSFKILSNMPLCFVSILEGIQGANAVYNPWEGHGARAIAAGVNAIRDGDAKCALVGGCDVKTHELGFLALEQVGVFDSWRQTGNGCVPGEGAAFLVLENEGRAVKREARIYARVRESRFRTMGASARVADTFQALMEREERGPLHAVVAAGDGDMPLRHAEDEAMERAGLSPASCIHPKVHLGNLFAGAAAVQVALGAVLASQAPKNVRVQVNCFGVGSEQAVFELESP